MTTLESLANELLLEVFEFFNGVQLFDSFYGLNSRFDNLLLKQFRIYHLDFQSKFKKSFCSFGQTCLPIIIKQVISLCLTDEDKDLHQTDLVISNHVSLRQFTHLKSLTLCYIRSTEIFNKIISDCSALTHLTLKDSKLRWNQDYLSIDLNNIWNLPKLICFHLKIRTINISLLSLTITSLSLENLMILREFWFTQPELASLLVHTPRLKRLYMNNRWIRDQHLLSTLPPINTLQRLFLHTSGVNTMLLQKMPNLCHLTVDVKRDSFADGYKWEQIIINYLPKLKVFRFKMHFKCLDNIEACVNELLNSFRSPFWIDKHQWFVRCHWDPEGDSKFIFLYTIPYGFHYFPFNNNVINYKSTCPNDNEYNSYDRVHQLYFSAHESRDLSKFHVRFPNIRHLNIQLPLNDHFWSIVPMLDKVNTLNVTLRGNDSQSQLLTLVNSTSCLNRLRIQLASTRNKYYSWVECHLIKINNEDDSQQYSTTVHRSNPYSDDEAYETVIKNHTDLLDLMNSIINVTKTSISAEDLIAFLPE